MTELPREAMITAPCRIHLGLLSVQESSERRFGGAGVMLEQPALRLVARRSESNQCTGHFAKRTEEFVRSWRKHSGIQAPIHCDIRSAPAEHVGLGLGTQLGMSVATALDMLFERQNLSLSERATSVGRGLRSAVGTLGFQQGGLIVESGKLADESLGELAARVELPEAWRVMLVRVGKQRGLAGAPERHAFRSLQGQNSPHPSRLKDMLFESLLPAAREGDFESFSEHVYRYGFAAGEMFATSQGGPFLNDSIAQFVAYCREHQVRGVGQSSWGPTVFCWFPSEVAAEAFKAHHVSNQPNLEPEVIVTAVSRTGANVLLS